jgi:hypothetical protein
MGQMLSRQKVLDNKFFRGMMEARSINWSTVVDQIHIRINADDAVCVSKFYESVMLHSFAGRASLSVVLDAQQTKQLIAALQQALEARNAA